ncbi:MAG TPA: hypothetical protein VNQ50_04275 [Xanthobacteraceae bacterium]|jgi:hypothetical protein|nr:hypothetical protein [Xanthobacteraceae bacterium]
MLRSKMLQGLCLAAGLFATVPVPAAADAGSDHSKATFGNRTDKPDGSSSLTMGRSLPSVWDMKVGADVSLAAPVDSVPSENLLRGLAPNASSGAVWGTMTLPGVSALGFDKTAVKARLDAGNDEGQLGATLSRSVPLNRNFSVTVQNSYSVTQPLATAAPAIPIVPLAAEPSTAMPTASPSPTWTADQSLRLDFKPSGTTLSAAGGASTGDAPWHNKFSLEQTLFGPVKVTTSFEDAGLATHRQSITAGFKRVW